MSYRTSSAFLANLIYDNSRVNPTAVGSTYIDPSGSSGSAWQLRYFEQGTDSQGIANGYQGAVFMNAETNAVVAVNRGTEPVAFDGDIWNDIQMGLGQLPNQLQSAERLYDQARRIATSEGLSSNDVLVTGHSLGGSLSQLIGARYGAQTETFNAYGVGNLLSELGIPDGSFTNITNHVTDGDPVSVFPGSKMLGQTLDYHTKAGDFWNSHSATNFLDPTLSQQAGKPVHIEVPSIGAWSIKTSDMFVVLSPIAPIVNIIYLAARSYIRRDPLALDLDGDGIETVGASGNKVTLFDYDNDGIRTGTGWIGTDDAFVVLDRNGNGTIDHGGELFGVDTVLANGTKAADGFAALADLDTNHDGRFSAADAAYSQVRLWQDANQDGISQSSELKTLAEKGVAAIHLTATSNGQILGNGNQIGYAGTYDKVGGGTGGAYALNLADNPFYRQYPDGTVDISTNPFAQQNAPIPLTAEAQTLPDVKGAGGVRDLREAASLDAGLAQAVEAQIDAGWQTHQALWNRMDELVERWANTSDFATSLGLAQAAGMGLHYGPRATFTAEVLVRDPDGHTHLEYMTIVSCTPASEHERMIGILERFNGITFVTVQDTGVTQGNGGQVMAYGGSTGVPLAAPQMQLIERSYAELKLSLYGGLALATRLKPYLDDVSLIVDETGIRLDASAMEARLEALRAGDKVTGLVDALELRNYAGSVLDAAGWDGEEVITAWEHGYAGDGTIWWQTGLPNRMRGTSTMRLPCKRNASRKIWHGWNGRRGVVAPVNGTWSMAA